MNFRAMSASILGLALIVASVSRADDAAKESEKLQGTWRVTKIVDDGKAVPAEKVKGQTFVFARDKLTMGAKDEGDTFTFKLDPSKKPKAIDLTEGGTTTPAVYELKGDTLTICLPRRGAKDRPAGFESKKGSELSVITLTRAKKQ